MITVAHNRIKLYQVTVRYCREILVLQPELAGTWLYLLLVEIQISEQTPMFVPPYGRELYYNSKTLFHLSIKKQKQNQKLSIYCVLLF